MTSSQALTKLFFDHGVLMSARIRAFCRSFHFADGCAWDIMMSEGRLSPDLQEFGTVPEPKRFEIGAFPELDPADFLFKLNENCVIAGPVGTGKTCAALALAFNATLDERWDRPIGAEWVHWVDLLLLFQKAWDEDVAERLEQLARTDVLLIDDFGRTQIRTDNRFEHLIRLMDQRSNSESPVIVTTNCKPEELAANVGDAVLDRLLATPHKFKFAGESRRKAAW